MRRVLALLAVFLLIAPSVTRAAGTIRWPEDYLVAEESKSPNGHYAVLIPNAEAADDDEDTLPNYLVNLKAHRILGKIRGIHYFEHANRRSLRVIWAADSTWCVAEWNGRYTFEAIAVAETDGTTFTSMEIGKHVRASLDAAILKQSGDSNNLGEATASFRLSPDRKLRVHATATTNARRTTDDRKTYCALFQGTFDLKAKKWTVTDAHSIENDEPYLYAYAEETPGTYVFASNEERLKWWDDRLNEVYGGVRFILGPARSSAVKKEQIAWLAKRDAARSPAEKVRLIEARIRALQELVW